MNYSLVQELNEICEVLPLDLIQGARRLCEAGFTYDMTHGIKNEYFASANLKFVQVFCASAGLTGEITEMTSVVQVFLNEHSLGFVRIEGTYSSWDTREWYVGQMKQVAPMEIRQTVYLPIDGSEDARYELIIPRS